MRLTIRPFAQLQERLGTKVLELELPPGATVAVLLELLVAEHLEPLAIALVVLHLKHLNL